jgi:hypothetical protein
MSARRSAPAYSALAFPEAGTPRLFGKSANARGLRTQIARLIAQDPRLMLQIFGCLLEDSRVFLIVV